MEQAAASTFTQFFAAYGQLGLFILAMLFGAGILLWLGLRQSKENRADNQGKITAQAKKIDELEAEVVKWQKDYFTLYGQVSGALDRDGNPIVPERNGAP